MPTVKSRKSTAAVKVDARDALSVEMGRRLKVARDFLGLKVPQLSRDITQLASTMPPDKLRRLIPLMPSRISNWEQGTKQIGVREAWSLARVLQTDPAYLLCLEDHPMTPQERELLKNFRALPERERTRISARVAVDALQYRDAVTETGQFHAVDPQRMPLKRNK